MTTGLFRDLVLARAMAVEPVRHVACADPLDADTPPFAQRSDRWRIAARRAAQLTWTATVHDGAVDPNDDAYLP
jgi:hypothetical protein